MGWHNEKHVLKNEEYLHAVGKYVLVQISTVRIASKEYVGGRYETIVVQALQIEEKRKLSEKRVLKRAKNK